MSDTILRRDLITGAGAALTTSLFTGEMRGANDKITVACIGLGAMGAGNLEFAIKAGAQVVTVCDVYKPHLDRAVASAAKYGQKVQATDDFRQVLSDKSIDAVCISTPDHWHAYLMVEACKAGKDVYVEKPACVYVDEGKKMVAAARKYNRVVQGGTMQRSGGYFRKAAELVKSGALGDVTFCHAYQCGLTKKEGYGNPPDSDPPADLNWDLWLGPAPLRQFNANRWGVKAAEFPTFRYFWDYAGGAMTDWGVHLIDPIHQCFGEVMPTAVTALGNKFYVEDNTETPDTMMATFYYPHFLSTYESRTCNPMPMFNMKDGGATVIHGTEASIFVNRRGCWLTPTKSTGTAQAWENNDEMRTLNVPHWKNFLSCIKTREKPTSEIETTVRSSTVCLLGNLAMRNQTRLDWDEDNWTVKQTDVQAKLEENYRSPWKLEV